MNNPQLKYPYTSLDYAEDLVKAGFNEAQSKAQARALFRVIEQNAVTKQDLKDLEVKLSTEIKELDVRIKELDVKLTYEMKTLQGQLIIKLSVILGGMLTLAVTAIGFLINILH